jgi:hypothetical protein
LIIFDYEPSLDGEIKVVKTIYEKLTEQFDFSKKLDDEQLKLITEKVRNLRQALREYNLSVEFSERFLSQDLNDVWHFLYIRFYEKLLKDILMSSDNVVSLKDKLEEMFLPYVQDKIV